MDEEKCTKKVRLHCPTCGNTQFEFEEIDDPSVKSIHCPSCNRDFSKDELIKENAKVIDENIDDIKKDVVKDLKNIFKRIK